MEEGAMFCEECGNKAAAPAPEVKHVSKATNDMKRWLQIFDNDDDFVKKCSCAVACGYIPCGNGMVHRGYSINSADGRMRNDGSISLSIGCHNGGTILYQMFYDPEGKASYICCNCKKIANCQRTPESDIFCKCFADKCYGE
jgi:hypothetical protein